VTNNSTICGLQKILVEYWNRKRCDASTM